MNIWNDINITRILKKYYFLTAAEVVEKNNIPPWKRKIVKIIFEIYIVQLKLDKITHKTWNVSFLYAKTRFKLKNSMSKNIFNIAVEINDQKKY